MSAAAELERWRETIDQCLERLFAELDAPSAELVDAMRYAVTGGGKRLRPLIVLASCRAVGGTPERALPAALAVELLHGYSLVHDDLPAMDDDELRRGRPTVHVVFGDAIAVLAGDALQSLAFETLSGIDSIAPVALREQLKTLARAAGVCGMAGGQALDLAAASERASAEQVARIHRHKTGALMAASYRLGGASAGAETAVCERLERVGERVGLAFQIQDDILDCTAPTSRLGKTAGKDVAAGKATWPALVGIESARRQASDLLNEALAELAVFGADAEPLRELTRRAVERAT
ncbi:MAG: polyprenyl synthetase family protein [Acidobacteriota bacterium]|nr:MAG: polyprenyl synthetase family protein [Acidobacteriota bacterium]